MQNSVRRTVVHDPDPIDAQLVYRLAEDWVRSTDLPGVAAELFDGGWLECAVHVDGALAYVIDAFDAPGPAPVVTHDEILAVSATAVVGFDEATPVIEDPRSWCSIRLADPTLLSVLAGSKITPTHLALTADLVHARILCPPEAHRDLRGWSRHELMMHHRSRVGTATRSNRFGVSTARITQTEIPAVRTPHPGRRIPLPVPDTAPDSSAPLQAVVEQRTSVRSFSTTSPITIDELGALLYRCARVRGTSVHQGSEGIDKPYPSAGARHELEIYPLLGHVDGLDDGLYHYDSAAHSLNKVAERGHRSVRALLGGAQTVVGDTGVVPVLLIIAARFGRIFDRYDELGYSLILRDAGVLLQTLQLTATDLGLGAVAVGSGDRSAFADATGLDQYVEGSVADLIVGRPVTRDERATPEPGDRIRLDPSAVWSATDTQLGALTSQGFTALDIPRADLWAQALMPLLDGTRSRADILDGSGGDHREFVRALLDAFDARGLTSPAVRPYTDVRLIETGAFTGSAVETAQRVVEEVTRHVSRALDRPPTTPPRPDGAPDASVAADIRRQVLVRVCDSLTSAGEQAPAPDGVDIVITPSALWIAHRTPAWHSWTSRTPPAPITAADRAHAPAGVVVAAAAATKLLESPPTDLVLCVDPHTGVTTNHRLPPTTDPVDRSHPEAFAQWCRAAMSTDIGLLDPDSIVSTAVDRYTGWLTEPREVGHQRPLRCVRTTALARPAHERDDSAVPGDGAIPGDSALGIDVDLLRALRAALLTAAQARQVDSAPPNHRPALVFDPVSSTAFAHTALGEAEVLGVGTGWTFARAAVLAACASITGSAARSIGQSWTRLRPIPSSSMGTRLAPAVALVRAMGESVHLLVPDADAVDIRVPTVIAVVGDDSAVCACRPSLREAIHAAVIGAVARWQELPVRDSATMAVDAALALEALATDTLALGSSAAAPLPARYLPTPNDIFREAARDAGAGSVALLPLDHDPAVFALTPTVRLLKVERR